MKSHYFGSVRIPPDAGNIQSKLVGAHKACNFFCERHKPSMNNPATHSNHFEYLQIQPLKKHFEWIFYTTVK